MTNGRRYVFAGGLVGFTLSAIAQLLFLVNVFTNDTFNLGLTYAVSLSTAVAAILYATAVGAIVGAALALVGRSTGLSWMSIGAAVGLVVAIAQSVLLLGAQLAYSRSPGDYYWTAVLTSSIRPALSTAAITAAAAGFLWYFTRGKSPAEQTLDAESSVSGA